MNATPSPANRRADRYQRQVTWFYTLLYAIALLALYHGYHNVAFGAGFFATPLLLMLVFAIGYKFLATAFFLAFPALYYMAGAQNVAVRWALLAVPAALHVAGFIVWPMLQSARRPPDTGVTG